MIIIYKIIVVTQNERQYSNIVFLYQVSLLICKAVPLQAWSGSEGSRKLRFPDFMTTAQDGGKVITFNIQSIPVTGLEWPKGFQEVKVPRFHDNGTGWW